MRCSYRDVELPSSGHSLKVVVTHVDAQQRFFAHDHTQQVGIVSRKDFYASATIRMIVEAFYFQAVHVCMCLWSYNKPWAIKLCHCGLDNNSGISWTIFTISLPVETGMYSMIYLTWRFDDVITASQNTNIGPLSVKVANKRLIQCIAGLQWSSQIADNIEYMCL